MSLESKLISGMKSHLAKSKAKESKEPKEPKGQHTHVSIEKLDNGYTVTGHGESGGEYSEGKPVRTAHKSVHEAFRHAKSLMVPEGQNSDEGMMG